MNFAEYMTVLRQSGNFPPTSKGEKLDPFSTPGKPGVGGCTIWRTDNCDSGRKEEVSPGAGKAIARKSFFLYFGMTLVVCALVGCAAKRKQYDVPAVPLPAEFQNSAALVEDDGANTPPAPPAPEEVERPRTPTAGDTAKSAAAKGSSGPAKNMEDSMAEWWRLLGNPELNALVERALVNNQDLRIAASRITQARIRTEQAKADQLPSVAAHVMPRFDSPVNPYVTAGTASSNRTISGNLQADWHADIWGERQSMYESANLQLQRAILQYDDAQRVMVAGIVYSYAEYLSLNDHLSVAIETENVLNEILASNDARMEAGDATIIDVEQHRSAVFAAKAMIPVMKRQREAVLNRLALLAGTVAGSLKLSNRGLDSLSYPVVQPGVPSALLLRRPDVRMAEARLLAADADIDIARARVLPQMDLSAQLGTGTVIFAKFLQPQALVTNVIANLSATIFDHGKREKEVDYAKALYDEMVETYVKVVYGAVREVEDALVAVQTTSNQLKAHQESLNAALRVYRVSRQYYDSGVIDRLTLLDIERTYHRSLDEFLRVRMENYRGMVELFQALGGGVQQGDVLPGEGKRPS